MKPTAHKVIIEPYFSKKLSENLISAQTKKSLPDEGIVIAVPDEMTADLKVGDIVKFNPKAGINKFKYEDKDVILISEFSIYGIIDNK